MSLQDTTTGCLVESFFFLLAFLRGNTKAMNDLGFLKECLFLFLGAVGSTCLLFLLLREQAQLATYRVFNHTWEPKARLGSLLLFLKFFLFCMFCVVSNMLKHNRNNEIR